MAVPNAFNEPISGTGDHTILDGSIAPTLHYRVYQLNIQNQDASLSSSYTVKEKDSNNNETTIFGPLVVAPGALLSLELLSRFNNEALLALGEGSSLVVESSANVTSLVFGFREFR